jgi:D-alanyl-D-alanine carboxypeptidase (penicillin-binding protein 5/6)
VPRQGRRGVSTAGGGRASGRAPGGGASLGLLTDLESGEYLAEKDASKKFPITSTTKVMEALVVLERADLDEEVTLSRDAAAYATPAYSNVGLLRGDTSSVRELLAAALISFGDDAAYALAEHVGGGGEAGVTRFVEEMNEEAKTLGLKRIPTSRTPSASMRGVTTPAREV